MNGGERRWKSLIYLVAAKGIKNNPKREQNSISIGYDIDRTLNLTGLEYSSADQRASLKFFPSVSRFRAAYNWTLLNATPFSFNLHANGEVLIAEQSTIYHTRMILKVNRKEMMCWRRGSALITTIKCLTKYFGSADGFHSKSNT